MNDIQTVSDSTTNPETTQQSEPTVSPSLPTTETVSDPLQPHQPTTNPSFTVELESRKSKKWMWPVIILVLAIALAVAGFFLYQNTQLKLQVELVGSTDLTTEVSPTPSPINSLTEGWATYTGEAFSFKYPAELVLEQDELITLRTEVSLSPIADPALLIDARFMFPHESLEQALGNNKDLEVISQTEKSKVVRISGKIKEGAYRANMPVLLAYFQRDEGVVSIESVGDQIDPQLFDQILSTFEFNTAGSERNLQIVKVGSPMVELRVPADLKVEEQNTSIVQFYKGNQLQFTLTIIPRTEPSFWSRTNPEKTVVINGIKWQAYPKSEYCDAGDCGETSAAYESEIGETRYSFVAVAIEMSRLEEILQSAKFK